MRPLFHPSIEDVTVEAILHALSDPIRVAIYADIVGSECSQNCSNFLKVNNKSRCAEIEKRFPGLILSIVNAHNIQLAGKTRTAAADQRKPAKRKGRSK